MDPQDPRDPLDDIDEIDDDDDDSPPQFYLTTFIPKPAWYGLDAGDATRFLENRVAQLNEAFVEDDEGVIWAYRYHVMERAREVDAVVLLWMITSDEALETLEATLRRSDVNKYFDWSVIGGPQNNAPQDILGAFLGTLVHDDNASGDEPSPSR
ncbi:hypothetical protein WPS_00960 [Vulcanimicrobium alpinum]|uniref:Uncharacterized protein n=1 Tax=Vulcanimicrobium alpinum TaxID=3016050 RepID=A0AAN1XRW5_UNVUL|nr:hypothetical protein [Vulcanimicrobium alpinum]BDE04820.1 hypothetical protein WPS_00960 [Vulcanimicrobium alpinum]